MLINTIKNFTKLVWIYSSSMQNLQNCPWNLKTLILSHTGSVSCVLKCDGIVFSFSWSWNRKTRCFNLLNLSNLLAHPTSTHPHLYPHPTPTCEHARTHIMSLSCSCHFPTPAPSATVEMGKWIDSVKIRGIGERKELSERRDTWAWNMASW